MISVIIPILNEKVRIGLLLERLQKAQAGHKLEIIVVEGGNEKLELYSQQWPLVKWLKTKSGRAVQMNAGAKIASGTILYFLHADALPPTSFQTDIESAIASGIAMGSFKFRLVPESFFTNINSFFSGFNSKFSGGGDQSLFIKKEIFDKEGGFDESYCIMEDFEFVHRLKPKYGFHIVQKEVLVSARKYMANNYLKVNFANYRAFKMYEKGVKPEVIKDYYYKWLKKGD